MHRVSSPRSRRPAPHLPSRRWPLKPVLCTVLALVWGGAACSDADEPACLAGSGPVSGPADTHCQGPTGPIVQDIGMCVTGAEAAASEEDAEEEEETFAVFYGSEADDDDCKYHMQFQSSCAALNQPVTFKLKLTRKSDGAPAAGAAPRNLEVYMADDAQHISPSNDIEATESAGGNYKIGPVVFDRSGRWVVRFHVFDTCSDVPDDAPHGHAAFYFDVP
jgi:hypothetical protein